jgi:ATP-binding cassette subfamily B protein
MDMAHGMGRDHSHGDGGESEVLGKAYDPRIVGRLLKYLTGGKLMVSLGAGGMIIRTLAALVYPWLVGEAIDRYLTQGSLGYGNYNGLNTIAIYFFIAAFLGFVGQFAEARALAYAGQSVILKLRTQMFDHLQRLSLSFFERNAVGRIMSRVQNDVQQLQQLLTSGFLSMLTNVLTIIGIAFIMVTMNLRLGLLTLSVVPVLGVVVVIWQKYASRAFVRVRRAIAVVNAGLQENISGVRVVQSLSREDENFEQFNEVNEAHLNANVRASQMSSIMLPVVELLVAAATALVIIYGGFSVLEGAMTAGVLVAFLLYIQRFFNPIRELAMQYTQLQRAMASGSRIFELLDTKPEIKDDAHAIALPNVRNRIQFHNVSFSYERDIEVLNESVT